MKKKYFIINLLLVIILCMSSCSKKSDPKPMKIEKQDEASESLIKLREQIDAVLLDIEKIKFQEQSSKPEDSSEGQDNKKKEGTKKTDWKDVDKAIKETHFIWNSYEVEGVKKGATSEDIRKFEDSLNRMTISVENKDYNNIIKNGSEVYLSLSSFFDFYKDEIGGYVLKIKSYIYQTYLYGSLGDWAKAGESIAEGKTFVNNIRQRMKKDYNKTKVVEKLNYSLENMENAIKDQNIDLVRIKKDIVIKNLEELEK